MHPQHFQRWWYFRRVCSSLNWKNIMSADFTFSRYALQMLHDIIFFCLIVVKSSPIHLVTQFDCLTFTLNAAVVAIAAIVIHNVDTDLQLSDFNLFYVLCERFFSCEMLLFALLLHWFRNTIFLLLLQLPYPLQRLQANVF